jgi:hypothetical protein
MDDIYSSLPFLYWFVFDILSVISIGQPVDTSRRQHFFHNNMNLMNNNKSNNTLDIVEDNLFHHHNKLDIVLNNKLLNH